MKHFCLLLFLFSSSVAMAQTPAMQWDFETIKNGAVIESSTGIADTVEGNFEQASGVHGKGLRLDGFTTRVIRNGKDIVTPGTEFTIAAWVSLGQYPLNWCPVITTESAEVKGYRLLIGPYGQVSFETAIGEQWISCTSANETMPLREWMHIVAVYTAGKQMSLYVNGEALCTVAIQGSMTYPAKTACIIGMVAAPGKPSDAIRTWGTMADYYGLDGIIDEVMVFDIALTAAQIMTAYANAVVTAPDIPLRKLPTIENNPGRFGAFYTKLRYYDGWDNVWPVDEDPDVVVCFDNNLSKFIFWRGVRYGPCWVSENENWMTDQSLETWANGIHDTEGCFEHMQDRHCRLSHVRIIENNDARAVVHWRYAPVSSRGSTWMPDPKTGWECWVDEYYYIYPDGSAIRKVSWNKDTTGSAVQYQESLPVTQPGQRSDQLLANDYVHVADYDYNTRAVSVDLRKQPADWPGDYTIQQFSFKSQNKPYICFEPGNRMSVRWIDGGYNHFPVNQARCDGRWARTLDRPSHISSSPCSHPVIHENHNRLFWNGLYGMNRMDMIELVRFGRSWAYPAELSTGPDFISKGYDRSQRCYQLANTSGKATKSEINLAGSKESPVVNPAFYIKNWNANGAKILVNGKAHVNYKTGIHRRLEGDDLVVFVGINEVVPVNLTIVPPN